ncbi:hypothetical protein JCM10450v2_002021 [Rhodotorula kratochvilovae]
MHDLLPRAGNCAHEGTHKRMMHKRQRVITTDEATTTARRTTTTSRRRATTTTNAVPTAVAGLVTDLVGSPSSSTSFQPGVAASGTATRSVGNTPPTRTHSTASTSYTYSFAGESSLSRSPAAATGSSAAAAETGLSQGAVTGIAVGAGVLGVLLLAGIGWCCWKKRKGKDDDDLGWTNLGDGPGAGKGGARKAGAPTGLDAWASHDTLASGPYGGGEKPWAQQSFTSVSSFDEKGYAHSPQQQHHALPVFAPQNIHDARAELLGAPVRSGTQQSFPRTATNASIASAPADRARPATGAQSVNDVITFSAPPPATHAISYPPSPAPAHLASRGPPTPPPASHAQFPLPPSTPQQVSRPSQPQHLSLNGVPVGPQAITAAHYPPRRPVRPSEVPSVAPGASPYQFARRPEQAQRDTQELERDERLEGRFVEVMTGQVGREESEERPRERSKKDTIMGLTDAYGGEDEEDDDEDEERDQVDPTFPPAQLLRRTSSRKRPPPPSSTSHPLPTEPSAAQTRSSPPSNPRRYSTRVDSKPLRELEAMFDQLPPSSRYPGVRASEASDLSGLAAAAGVRLGGSSAASYRTSDASSYTSPPAPVTAPLAFTRRPLGAVPESDSKDSLSPLSAGAAGAHSPYGEAQRYEHSIYSAAGEVGDLSSSSLAGSAGSSPAKSPLGSPLAQRSLGAQPALPAAPSPLSGAGAGDVFDSAPAIAIQPPARKSSVKTPAAPLQCKTSTRPAAPAPLRLTRNASLAHGQAQPSTPSAAEARHPLTLSTAERDVLHELGLPGTPELSSSPLLSAEPSPSSSLGTPGSSVLATPQTPVFHLSRPSLPGGGDASFIDVSPSPSPSRESFAPQKAPPVVIVDPLAAGGWESLSAMAAGKGGAAQDASYRSATMSLYGMYEQRSWEG